MLPYKLITLLILFCCCCWCSWNSNFIIQAMEPNLPNHPDQKNIADVDDIDSEYYDDADFDDDIDDEEDICQFYNPDEDVIDWGKRAVHNTCLNKTELTANSTEVETERQNFGWSAYSFNVLVSDRIGPFRVVPETRHELCWKKEYSVDDLPSASIVIVYHNEALSVFIRMINSIILQTPPQLIQDFVFLDDFSDPEHEIAGKVRKYGQAYNWPLKKMIFERTQKWEGLIRAKVIGSKLAKGDVLIFLDSHCEAGENWLPPLLDFIKHHPKSVALPIVDVIDPFDFRFEQSMVQRGGFEWDLSFKWHYLDWSYLDVPENNVAPIKSPNMSGGLLAIRREWFTESGEYDEGMEIWGGENAEMALRMWMCGEGVWVLPCSRVGHVFRHTRPYGKSDYEVNSFVRNAQRAAHVWMDQHLFEFYKRSPAAEADINLADLEDRHQIRRKLNCHNFDWYLKNIYPELAETLASGHQQQQQSDDHDEKDEL